MKRNITALVFLSIIFVITSSSLCSTSSLARIKNLCDKLENKYGEFGVLIINCNTGMPLFCVNSNIVYHNTMGPGSTIKPFTLIALNKSEIINPDKKFNCRGWGNDPQNIHLCWHQTGHGSINLIDAIAFSCNFYFRKLLNDSFEQIVFLNTLASFRIINSIKEIQINMDLRDSAIGFDSYIQTNPYRMLYAYATFVNGGKLFDKNGKIIDRIDIELPILSTILSSMKKGYNYGTSSIIKKISGYKDGMAKTGTAMMYDGRIWYGNKLSGLVVLFFPVDSPETGLVVFVKQGKGNKEASEIAAEIVKVIKNGY